ncbi:hypothetical protein [Lacihabitans lacunae]|uniref:Group II intron maturase-specific domain-containing protein n=1 Tax=Lacihabitans lacunae TaxID=1028214 RepID=A0ABV7YR97_9BACT
MILPLYPLLLIYNVCALNGEYKSKKWIIQRVKDWGGPSRKQGSRYPKLSRRQWWRLFNKAKSGIRRPSNFELLGHAFVPTYKKGDKGKYQLVVKESSWQSLKRKLKAATKKIKPYSFDLRLAKIKEVYRGWVNKTD